MKTKNTRSVWLLLKPKVTIGVCVRNCAVSIEDALKSILEQDFPHEFMELIFVDDGSEDSTLSIIKSFVPKMDMVVKVFAHEWKGLGPSRNVVVNNANGEYIVWVDGDMILPRDHVRKQVAIMKQNHRVGIAKARYGMLREHNIIAALENIPFMVDDSKGSAINSKLPGTGGSAYRIDAIRQVGGFDNHFSGVGEDQDAAYRIKAKDWIIEKSSAVFYEKRVQTWKALWNKYFWYGYGDYILYRKNRTIFSLYKMVPIAGFIAGALYALDAYRLTSRKSVVLLPFHFAFKMVAWCLGFTKRKANLF